MPETVRNCHWYMGLRRAAGQSRGRPSSNNWARRRLLLEKLPLPAGSPRKRTGGMWEKCAAVYSEAWHIRAAGWTGMASAAVGAANAAPSGASAVCAVVAASASASGAGPAGPATEVVPLLRRWESGLLPGRWRWKPTKGVEEREESGLSLAAVGDGKESWLWENGREEGEGRRKARDKPSFPSLGYLSRSF